MPSLVATISIYLAIRSELWVAYLVAFIMIMTALTFTSVYVLIDDENLLYGFGSWMWPKREIQLDRVARVEVSTIHPMRYGGWGLRDSRHAIARRGPGIVLHLRGGSSAAITIDRADDAAAHIARTLTTEAPSAQPGSR